MAETLTGENLGNAAREKIENLFGEIAFFQKPEIRHETRQGRSPDLVVELSGKTGMRVLLVEIRASGEPRLAREAVNALLVETRLWSHAYPVFVAPYISNESAGICRENDVGYMDLAGNCHICFDSVYIHSEGKANPFKNKRRLKSLFRPKAARIIRVLLSHPRREWKTQELAREAGVSAGLVSNVKKILKDREWIDGKKSKISLIRPRVLLEKWIAGVSGEPSEHIGFYRLPLNFVQIENKVVEHCLKNNMDCAFTGLSGAVHVASDINYNQVQVYITGDIDAFDPPSGFEKDGSNPNLALIQTRDEGVLYKTRQVLPGSRLQYYRPTDTKIKIIEAEIGTGIRMVSPVQIYFDLRSKFGSYVEEADKVFRQVLHPSW